MKKVPSPKCSPEWSGIDRNVTISYNNRLMRFSHDIDFPVCMRNLDTHRRPSTQNTGHGDEMLPKIPQHIVYRACHT